jgi:hypothetical protein
MARWARGCIYSTQWATIFRRSSWDWEFDIQFREQWFRNSQCLVRKSIVRFTRYICRGNYESQEKQGNGTRIVLLPLQHYAVVQLIAKALMPVELTILLPLRLYTNTKDFSLVCWRVLISYLRQYIIIRWFPDWRFWFNFVLILAIFLTNLMYEPVIVDVVIPVIRALIYWFMYIAVWRLARSLPHDKATSCSCATTKVGAINIWAWCMWGYRQSQRWSRWFPVYPHSFH